jgi:hypothetical protein
MQPEAHSIVHDEAANGLPPVVPPSGKFIAQLFLVPFIIVTSILGFVLLVNWLVGRGHNPDDFIERLDSSNPDVRWRAAEDLAQVLLRDDSLAANPGFALDLAERLQLALRRLAAEEKNAKERAVPTALGGAVQGDEAMESEANYVLYLSACLGNFSIPVGVPTLSEMALGKVGYSDASTVRKRWRALWALANLGENLKRFDKLAPEKQESALDTLRAETTTPGSRGVWARAALRYLSGPQAKSLRSLGVEDVFTKCAGDPDPFVRSMTAFALNFWDGTESENASLEQLLVTLSRDIGHGEDALAKIREREGQADGSIKRVPVRYNATVALARKGSEKTRLDVLEEMLDESRQRENFQLRTNDGRDIADESTVSLTIVTALKAVVELHRKKPGRDLSVLTSALDKLAENPNIALRVEAEQTRLALGK